MSENEAVCTSQCDGPGILGICLAAQAPYIVMPFMANGSLHSYLRKHRAELLISEDEDIDLVEINNFTMTSP